MAPFRKEGRGNQGQAMLRPRPALTEMIARRLKLHYEEAQAQPLPRRLDDLLKQLDRPSDAETAPARRP